MIALSPEELPTRLLCKDAGHRFQQDENRALRGRKKQPNQAVVLQRDFENI
jgi:hypothetical protein